MASVLIVDDEIGICDVLSQSVSSLGHDAVSVQTLQDAIHQVTLNEFDVVFLDVTLPDGSGLDILPQIQGAPSAPEVIIITGSGDPDGAELAVRSGVWDYVLKGNTLSHMTLSLTRALQFRKEKLARKPVQELGRYGIVGDSPRLLAVLDMVRLAASSGANVQITGETGTGKELIARAIHLNSPRAGRNFVVVDCAALPETLVESVLFGHEKGAFTGADHKKDGLVLQADGGTLFLDEIGELPLAVQKSFLRVLQERCFRPVGGQTMLKSDFRLVSSTNRDLDEMVLDGCFREDLLFRLRTSFIQIPPLRQRKEDIRLIAEACLHELTELQGDGPKTIEPEFFELLVEHDWPGNVRELLNVVEMAFFAAEGDSTLFDRHLPATLRAKLTRASVLRRVQEARPDAEEPSLPFDEEDVPTFKEMQGNAEKLYLINLLALANKDIPTACEKSGLSRSQLYRLLNRYDIKR